MESPSYGTFAPEVSERAAPQGFLGSPSVGLGMTVGGGVLSIVIPRPAKRGEEPLGRVHGCRPAGAESSTPAQPSPSAHQPRAARPTPHDGRRPRARGPSPPRDSGRAGFWR